MTLKRLSEKKGAVALETIFGGGFILFLIILFIGFFTYLYPRYMVDLEVQQLSHNVRLDGHLSNDAYETFVLNMQERGYERDQLKRIYTPTDKTANGGIGVEVFTKDIAGNKRNLVQMPTEATEDTDKLFRGDGQIIVEVSVPAKLDFLSNGYRIFGISKNGMENYNVRRVVLPEAYQEFKEVAP